MSAAPTVTSQAPAPIAQTLPTWRERAARHESLVAVVLCGMLAWLAQFHHFTQFGLYEDDYWFISEAMGKDPSYLVTRFETALRMPQGRPFGFFLPDLFSWLGDRLGGLPAIYLLGFLIVTLNTFLCFRLLRTRVPVAAAAAGAAVFCLFAADTTKILLTHDFQLQPSLTFALLSGIAYASGRRPLAYLLSTGALLSYENGFLPLFGLPLFVRASRAWDRSTWRELVRHAAVLVGIVVGAVIVRYLVGESRATQSIGSLSEIVPKLLGSLVIGPPRAAAAMLYMPIRQVPSWDLETAACAVLALVLFVALFWALPRPKGAMRDALQVGGAGAVMLVLGYALAFTHYPPVALVGRGTSVHLGATLGMAVLGSACAWGLLSARRAVAVGVLAAYFALAVGYYVSIQRDFVRSWQAQRAFWQDVVRCCSDLQDGTVLLYELQASDESTTFIFTNSWGDALVLGEMLRFPAEWSNPPRLFSLTDWQSRVEAQSDGLRWWVPAASWDEHWEA
ncbi:MAG: hypothetical protein JOY61_21570, partial [Chloroflexi bacterium]|nr:hypothetical protein [Chloroflexota bacterium]